MEANMNEWGSHYTVNSVPGDGMEFLRNFQPNDINYVFLSTSGVHGTYCNLDQIELLFVPGKEEEARKALGIYPGEELPKEREITFCALLPRMVTTFYGNATVRSMEDVKYLRRLTEQTITGVLKLQEGNREH